MYEHVKIQVNHYRWVHVWHKSLSYSKEGTEEKVEGVKYRIDKAGRRRECIVCEITYIWSQDPFVHGENYGSRY